MSGILDAILRGLNSPKAGMLEVSEHEEDEMLEKDEAHSPPTSLPPHTPDTSFADMSAVSLAAELELASYSPMPAEENKGILQSPFGPSQRVEKPNDTFISSESTQSTPSVDLSFGPQMTPFALLCRQTGRQVVSFGETPSRTTVTSSKLRITSLPENGSQNPREKVLEEGEIEEEALSEEGGPKIVVMSNWRNNQLRTARTPYLTKDSTLKPIPALHGPLSLPYARNPSGVDAPIIDYSAHSAHLDDEYGLKTSDKQISPVYPKVRATAEQNFKESKPGTTHSDIFPIDQSVQSVQSICQSDSSLIGRAGVPSEDISPATPGLPSHAAKQLPPASAMLRAQADRHRGVHLQHIPEQSSSFDAFYHEAINATASARSSPTHHFEPGSQHQDTSFLSHPTPQDSLLSSMGGDIGEEDNEFALRSTSNNNKVEFSDAPSTSSPTVAMGAGHIGRADSSVDWRNREDDPQAPQTPTRTTMNFPGQVEGEKVSASTPKMENEETEIMTLETLFEKFGHAAKSNKNDTQPVSMAGPKTTASAKASSTATPASMQQHAKASRSPLEESNKVNHLVQSPTQTSPTGAKQSTPTGKTRSASSRKATSISAKGTPGAGKLLRKGKSTGASHATHLEADDSTHL